MNLLWSSTFTDALGKLSAQEQKQAKLTATDLLFNPKGNGHQLHRVESAPGFWTARVSQDVRIVLHKDGEHTLLAWVGHHDDAYRWAERRRLVPHERTGAMQFVHVIDAADERIAYAIEGADSGRTMVEAAQQVAEERNSSVQLAAALSAIPLPFIALGDDALLDVGVPRDWLEIVRRTETTGAAELFELLPAEAAEALLDFLTGGKLEDHIAVKADSTADPFVHPDAQRRFRVFDNVEELQAALDAPFEQWAVFLHPAQRALVDRDWKGPARVSGAAGTGKTIVALHRAVHLADTRPDAMVLLTTFSKPLAAALARKRDVLTEAMPALRDRVMVRSLDQAALELFSARFGQPNLATSSQIRAYVHEAREQGLGGSLSLDFLCEEWAELVDAWHVTDEDSYAAVPRIGRKTRLGTSQRAAAWSVFDHVRRRLADRRLTTWAQVYARLSEWLRGGGTSPFTHVVVDEAQDLSVAQVRFLAEVARGRPDGLFLAGDIGQRIFHLPFSWARLGLDVRGRSHCLKVNYRTSHQIRAAADRLLPPAITDLDGVEEGRRGTVSVFDGPAPQLSLAADEADECAQVAEFVMQCLDEGIAAEEIGVLVRSNRQLDRARSAIKAAGLDPRHTPIGLATMHDAKGLEFRAVCVMACDEDVLPDPERLATVGDMADLESAYETERHLLYVACTRARDRLLVSGIAPGSEFLDDLGG